MRVSPPGLRHASPPSPTRRVDKELEAHTNQLRARGEEKLSWTRLTIEAAQFGRTVATPLCTTRMNLAVDAPSATKMPKEL